MWVPRDRRRSQTYWFVGLRRMGEEVLLEMSALPTFLESGGSLAALMSNDLISCHPALPWRSNFPDAAEM